MLQSNDPVWIDGKYDDNGKWMDGWESRRRRDGKDDFCFIRLGKKASIQCFDIDTTHFTGNFAPGISIQGCSVPGGTTDDLVVDSSAVSEWFDLLDRKEIKGDSHNRFECNSKKPITHLKITIHPDGGIARFRAYGDFWEEDRDSSFEGVNVLSKESGARAIYANDEHFGCLSNILEKHEPLSMADGWETRRRREPGNDWGVLALSKAAQVEKIIVDTKHFKGNFPHLFSLSTASIPDMEDSIALEDSQSWRKLLEKQKLGMNQIHTFEKKDILHNEPFTHVRIDIYPDGGIARLKFIGKFI
jgi:allantoicase